MAERPALRVVVVDDDPALVRLATAVLRAAGFSEVREAGNVRDGLAAADDADVVLLDNQLPDALGVDAVARFRALPARPAVIVMTAHGTEAIAAQALRAGADDYLPKDEALVELLPGVLERVRRSRALDAQLAQAERELVRAERLAAIGEMTITLHHEINNPLMSAMTEVELLLEEPELPAGAAESLRSVRDALRRIAEIVRRVANLRDASATAYAAGMRMIDLAAAQASGGVAHGVALLWLPDDALARVVTLLLGRAGFQARTCATRSELEAALPAAGPSLVVVLGNASGTGSDALGGFVPPADRTWRLVALVDGDGGPALAAGADRVVQLPFDPERFAEDAAG